MTIDEEIDVGQAAEEEDFDSENSESAFGGQILEGSRNNTMSRFAGRVLKRYGITEKAYEAFLEHAKKCDPPLPESELKTIWNSAVKFFQKSIVNQEGYVPPDEYNADFESASLKPEDYSDIGQAKVLVREYGNELKYTSATDFLRFDGECWREDKQMAIGAVEEFLDLQLQDAVDEVARVEKALEDAGVPKESIQAGPKELLKEVDGKLIPLVYMLMGAQTYLKFVQKRRDYKYIVSAANTAKPMIAISVSDLDKNENLINTPYATYDLRKGLAGELPHNPEDLITKITACSPGEEGKQIWLDALNLFFCKDQKLIDYVQETVGMAAIGKVYQEHMIIAYGGGANGKSTFWNTIFRVLGNYAGKLDALEDMIEAANGRPVMVAYWFKHDLSRIMRRLTEKKIPFEKLDSEESIRKWNRGELPVALIHPASAGHGLNLQSGGNTLIWFGLTWSLELYQQTVARLWRQGQTAETVVVQHIITAGTIDEDVMKALANKDMTQNRLIAAVKARVTHGR